MRQSIFRLMRIVALIPKNMAKFAKNFARQFHTLYEQKSSHLRPLLSITLSQGFRKSNFFRTLDFEKWGQKTFEQSKQTNKYVKKKITRQFYALYEKKFQIWDNFIPLLFSKDSENLKSFDIGFQEVGANRPLNGVRNTDNKKILLSKENSPRHTHL